jgi:ABC-2 type transport system permease protein
MADLQSTARSLPAVAGAPGSAGAPSTTTVPVAAAAAPLLQMVLAQTRIELRLALRRGESVLITLIIPPVLLVFFGLVDLMPVPPDQRADFLVPGVLALAIMSTAMVSTGIATAFERYYKVLKRLGASPLPRSGLLIAKILSVVAMEAVQTLMIVGVATVVLGWRPTGAVALAPLVLLLGTAAFGGLGLLMAGALRAEATLAVANGLYLLFLLLGGIVFPTAQLGPWLAGPAALLPSTALADVLRGVLGAGGSASALSWGVLIGWAIIAPLAAARTFRWE